MSNISQFFAGTRKKNRRIFHGTVGVTTVTWLVPPGVTEVEVHCWGAGGSGGVPFGGGGGGGGYVTHVFPVTPSDRLLITAGASPGGTSSVSVPTQSPISPISATGGSAGNQSPGSNQPAPAGAGGVGSYTIAPGISTARTFSASGGAGGIGFLPAPQAQTCSGGGGAAGSLFGTGGGGGASSANQPASGGGIGGAGVEGGGGGGSLGAGTPNIGGLGKNGVSIASTALQTYTTSNDEWFYVDEILGSGGPTGAYAGTPLIGIPGGAGGGGAFSPTTGGNGGILGGGGGPGGRGGLAGGGGGGGSGVGGAGLVILYW